ncbi:MAG TPA: 2OG-Fe(II) oxygenase [Hyphomonadaceae bacterium]|jgi:prolyl 4-hydroxylase|nr:2OG-Fe(II) oxygenase [Hyphomonadaceae bacterium]
MTVEADQLVLAANRRLIGADGRLPDPAEASGLYHQAALKGSGRAANRLAVVAAMGVGRPADWREALDWLAEAAKLGDVPAQQQIALLSEHVPSDPKVANWKGLRGSIDIDRLLKPPAARRVSASPTIVLIDQLVPPVVCGWFIAQAQRRLQQAVVGDPVTRRWLPDPNRTGMSAGFGLLDTELAMVLAQERLVRATGMVLHQLEAPQVLSYEVGQQYKQHADYFNPEYPAFAEMLSILGQRVATCLTWLNDDFAGGETDFPKARFRHKGRTGDAMVFMNVTQDQKPDPMSVHAGLPVSQGRKWLLSQWVRDREQPII